VLRLAPLPSCSDSSSNHTSFFSCPEPVATVLLFPLQQFDQNRSTCSMSTTMSSTSSPSSSSPAARSSSRGTSNHQNSDANIRNFAPVARIMKSALPENAKIAKEAKECMQECVSEFISFITSEGKTLYHWKRMKSKADSLTSVRKVPAGEAKDCQWRGYSLCHDFSGIRKLRRSFEDLSSPLSRGKLPIRFPPSTPNPPKLFIFITRTKDTH
jgi:histone H3/H4